MRNSKAFLAAVLVFALVLSLCIAAFAAEGDVGNAGWGDYEDPTPSTSTEPVPTPSTNPGGSDGGDIGYSDKEYEIVIEETKFGTTDADHDFAESGETIIVTTDPEFGGALEDIRIVRQDNGRQVEFEDLGNGRYRFIMPASDVLVISTYRGLDLPFDDVNPGDWFYDAVEYAYVNGLMDGVSENEFGPNMTLTRAMVVTILYRYEGSPAVYDVSPFTDVVEGTWYADAVIWAAANDIVNGTSETTFSPNSPITREQFAAILFRYATYRAYSVSARADLSVFRDADQISAYAVDAMSWTVAEGIITGVTDTTLEPKGNTTRAQAAMILMRFAEKFGK